MILKNDLFMLDVSLIRGIIIRNHRLTAREGEYVVESG